MKGFWRDFILSFSIFRYKDLCKKSLKETVHYFIILFTLAYLIACIILLPGLIGLPKMLDSELSKLETFTVDIQFNTTEDIYLPSGNPYITISNEDNTSKSKFVVTKKQLIYRIAPGIMKAWDLNEFKDIKENQEGVVNIVVPMLIMLLPSIIILTYVFNILKYIIIILIFSLIMKAIISVMRNKVKYKKLVSSGIYTITPLILIHMIVVTLNINTYYIPLILYVIWYTVVSLELIEEF